jgi:hypothetical protein
VVFSHGRSRREVSRRSASTTQPKNGQRSCRRPAFHQNPRRAGGRGGETRGRRPRRGGGADAAQGRSGQADAGQRQQATAPQPATRPQEGEGERRRKELWEGPRGQATPSQMNTRSKRRLEALSRRYPAKLELRVPQRKGTPVNLRMRALTAARFDDILLRTSPSFTGTGSRDSRLYPLWDQTRIWVGPGGLATPNRAGVCGRPPTNRPLLAVREDGGVYSPSLRSRAVRLPATPCRVRCRVCF